MQVMKIFSPVVHKVAISLYDIIPHLLAGVFQAVKFYVHSFHMLQPAHFDWQAYIVS